MRDVVARHGLHGASMALLGGRPGVGAGTIYRYFASKDVLITACYAEVEERALAAVRQGYPESGTVRERLVHVTTQWIRHSVDHPSEYRFAQQFHDSPSRRRWS